MTETKTDDPDSDAPSTDSKDDETAILARLSDSVEAGALRDLLEAEGIAVSTPGLTHRSMLGIAGGYVDIVVRVPKKDLERARAIREALKAGPAAEGEAPRTDRLKRVAVFAALFLPLGGGHFYARRHRTAFFLLAAQILAIGLAFAWPLFWYAMPFVVLADVVGAVGAIGAMQRGSPPGLGVRLAPLLAIVALAAVPVVRVAAPDVLAGPAMRHACAIVANCADADELASACVQRAADRAFAGQASAVSESACLECLDTGGCAGMWRDCRDACAGLVRIPEPPVDTRSGPVGTMPSDLQLVVPSLFGPAPRSADAPTDAELEDLLRTLDETPPPSR